MAAANRRLAREVQEVQEELRRLHQDLQATSVNTNRVAKKEISTPKFDGEGDARQFVELFKMVADANQWDRNTGILNFHLALDSSVRRGVTGESVEQLCESLLEKYSITRQEARAALKKASTSPGRRSAYI